MRTVRYQALHALTDYHAGRSDAAWRSIRDLGASVRRDHVISVITPMLEATFCAVRHNIELLHDRLPSLGYQFMQPEQAFLPPSTETEPMLAEIEDRFGILPLSLFFFYKCVGSVDFRQSHDSYVSIEDRPGEGHSPHDFRDVRFFGDQDPICVCPLEEVRRQLRATEHAHNPGGTIFLQPRVVREVTLSVDAFHKSVFSGGEDYTVIIPDAAADFRMWGTHATDADPNWEEGEWFVEYLRAVFRGGGFRGIDGTIPSGTPAVDSLVDGLRPI